MVSCMYIYKLCKREKCNIIEKTEKFLEQSFETFKILK